MSRFVKAEVVGEHVGKSAETVLAWARSGRIPSIRLGRRTVLFCLDSVERALRELETKPEVRHAI